MVRSHSTAEFCLAKAVSILHSGRRKSFPEIMDEIVTTARDLELAVNEVDIKELIMEHENDLTTEELQELLNEKHQET